MPPDPPLVHLVSADRAVFMLGWEQHPDGSWWARVTWVEHVGGTQRRRAEWVRAGDVRPIAGEDYRHLARHRPRLD